MVTSMGMSKKLGQVAWSSSQGPSFVGQQMGQPADCSAETADTIDSEIKALVERAYRCNSLRLICVTAAFNPRIMLSVPCTCHPLSRLYLV